VASGLRSGVTVTVPRVDVCFDAEDPFQFVRRRVSTYALRSETEKALLYHLYVDSMPTEDVPPLTVSRATRWCSGSQLRAPWGTAPRIRTARQWAMHGRTA
jgi:hypothetical protein